MRFQIPYTEWIFSQVTKSMRTHLRKKNKRERPNFMKIFVLKMHHCTWTPMFTQFSPYKHTHIQIGHNTMLPIHLFIFCAGTRLERRDLHALECLCRGHEQLKVKTAIKTISDTKWATTNLEPWGWQTSLYPQNLQVGCLCWWPAWTWVHFLTYPVEWESGFCCLW